MSFGKRQSGVGASAQALNVGMVGAPSQIASEPAAEYAAEETRHPFRSLVGLLLCLAGLYWLISAYSRDIVRDHLLHGTWQPAYDLRATDGKCSRTNFILTTCEVNIKSVVKPDQAPIHVSFMMLFASGGGEALIPMRSTKDRAAVSIYYAAETKLWNRTLSFVFFVGAVAFWGLVALFLFLRAIRS